MAEAADTGTLTPGQVVAGRYRIIRHLGEGGMGVVYEAEHTTLETVVALKTLHKKFLEDAEVVGRFVQEAKAAARIQHPGIVRVFDLGHEEGFAFLAMEKLDGEELAHRIKREAPLSVGFVAAVGFQIADAIATAHEHGIVHRDLKPQNVFLTEQGRGREIAKVLDFGIAKLVEGDRADAPMTRTGQIMGTPLYMSPEQLRGLKDLDGRADIYAIGAMLYEALAGVPPFVAETYPDLIYRITLTEATPLGEHRPDAPVELVEVVTKAMHKDREERFQSARDLCAALESVASGADPRVVLPRTGPRPSMSQAFADTAPSGEQPAAPAALAATPYASESMRPPGSGPPSPLLRGAAIAGALGLVAAGVAAVLISQGGDGELPTADVQQAAGQAAGTTGPAADEEPGASPTPAAETGDGVPAPTAPVVPAPATVHFVSQPPGAQVRIDGEPACEAPCDAPLSGDRAMITATLEGYRTVEEELTAPFDDEVTLTLRRRRRTPRDRPSMTTEPSVPLPPIKMR